MKNRSTVVICWEVLKALSSGPLGPSRLARATNVPFDRLAEYAGPLLAKGLIRVDSSGGRDVYSITPEGMQVLGDLDKALPKLLM